MRIVSLAPDATSILCTIGAKTQLVGVTRWCPDVAPVKHLPQLGDCWKLESVDAILKLKPDLVIGSVPFKTETVGKLLENPVRFLALNPRTIADIENDILLLASIAGKRLGGERAVRKMRSEFASIRSEAPSGRNKLRIYCEAWPNPRISSPGWVAELVELCGAIPVFREGRRVNEAEVANANPDAIVLAWAATGDRANARKTYSVGEWKNTTAIANKKVFVVRDELLNTPAPILTRGARELLRIVNSCRQQHGRIR